MSAPHAPAPFNTLRGPGDSILEIKHSRFMGHAEPVRDEREARDLLARLRAAHPGAGHHAFAYRLGRAGETARFSDDGEPGGTAGRPIMEVLLREAIVDAVAMVSRVFGGVLLGSGGLTRAYSQAASAAIHRAGIVAMVPYSTLAITVAYAHLGAVEQALTRLGHPPTAGAYTDTVSLTVPVPAGREAEVAALIADLTAGQGRVDPGAIMYRVTTDD